jgi:hypothetical protein
MAKPVIDIGMRVMSPASENASEPG